MICRVDRMLAQYPGTHVAFTADGYCVWTLTGVDFVKRKAWVVNGAYQIEWDDTDMYHRCPAEDRLVWMFEIEPGFHIVRADEVWLDQRNELKPGSPGGAESRGCSA